MFCLGSTYRATGGVYVLGVSIDPLDLSRDCFFFFSFFDVQTCPQLFGCSTKSNLGPTLSFFREELGGTRGEIRELVLSNPTLLRRVCRCCPLLLLPVPLLLLNMVLF